METMNNEKPKWWSRYYTAIIAVLADRKVMLIRITCGQIQTQTCCPNV